MPDKGDRGGRSRPSERPGLHHRSRFVSPKPETPHQAPEEVQAKGEILNRMHMNQTTQLTRVRTNPNKVLGLIDSPNEWIRVGCSE